jgi:division protein CdvB (Snf7/Vps24/ESCRT-III family)
MTGGNTVNFQAANSEAERILNEASSVVEQRMQEQLPEIPAEITLDSRGRGILTA